MMNLFDFAILSFSSIFVIVDPFGLIPTFLAMTERDSTAQRIRMSMIASFTTFFILILCQLFGQRLLSTFGITLPAFQIAGGIVLLFVGLDMLHAKRTAVKETLEEKTEGTQKDDVAVTPMAVPMLAGPGAMTAVILLTNQAHSIVQHGILALNILIVSFLTFVILWFVATRTAMISVIVLRILSRLMGLLLSAIAIQFILNGLKASRIL